ncbi:MAG: hypothetical protein VX738_14825 [Planctomycetota bacterium]|nr:hypothetical protein [Planctomycetota bacterium]
MCLTGGEITAETPGVPPYKSDPVSWFKPLAKGPLKVLIVIPVQNIDQVTELSKRMAITPTVLATADRFHWTQSNSNSEFPKVKPDLSDAVLTNAKVKTALQLTNRYDVILLGKLSWSTIPQDAKTSILAHVKRGSGLLYISPNTLPHRINDDPVSEDDFKQLFTGPDALGVYKTVYSRTAYGFSSIVYFRDRASAATLPGLPRDLYRQAPLYISSHNYHNGRIIALDYDDAGVVHSNNGALTPYLYSSVSAPHEARMETWFLSLGMAMLHSADRFPTIQVSFLAKSVLPTPGIDRNAVTSGSFSELYVRRFFRYRLEDSEYYVVPPAAREDLKEFRFRIRSERNTVMVENDIAIAGQDRIAVKLPVLEHGHYVIDGHYLDKMGNVISSGSTSFMVVSQNRIGQCTLPKTEYSSKESIQGQLLLTQAVSEEQTVEVQLRDANGKILTQFDVTADAFSRRYRFNATLSGKLPPRCFLHSMIGDQQGIIFRHVTELNIRDATQPNP